MADNFFFVALPYISLLLFIGGSAYRAFTGLKTTFRGKPTWSVRGDMLWTTRSSGFFGRASIGPAVLSLHWGLLFLGVAHVVGFIGGALNWPGWVEVFRWLGLASGVLVLYGACWAFARRLASPQLRAMSTGEDYILLLFLIAIAGFGLYHAGVRLAWGVSYGAGAWAVSLLTIRPDASLIAGAPISVKLHMIVAMLFFAYFPFAKVVHAFSYPFGYFTRPYISMRTYAGLKR
jgi:nitrate reductase gamma subunit